MEYRPPPKSNPLQHLILNIRDSTNGLNIMFRESSTFQRIYPMMIGGAMLLGLIFDFIMLEYVILAGILILDVVTETLNSAIEEVCDRVTREEDSRIKRSKDIASAAVYIMHLCYIGAAAFFALAHCGDFAWWRAIIPA